MEFINSNTCIECHQEIVEDHYQTAHYNSFKPANKNTIKGSFKKGENTFKLNDQVTIKMISKDTNYFQQLIIRNTSSRFDQQKIDLVIGSGTRGQSYLTWDDNELSQIQASYFKPTDNWVNSPGMPKQIINSRPIFDRCLECHTTYAETISGDPKDNRYKKNNFVFGIDCQRCHGPVKEHVVFHRKHLNEKQGKFILKHNSLSRQQKLDGCALCHSGPRTEVSRKAFSFMIGDSLKKFSNPDYTEKSLTNLDVHGNQYGLLMASKCFQKSEIMDCTTCHNPHKTQKKEPGIFNQKCISCHREIKNSCNGDPIDIKKTKNNCIQCHMPMANSKSMKINILKKEEIPVQLRTHLIGIYK